MNVRDFGKSNQQTIAKSIKFLREHYNLNIDVNSFTRSTLGKLEQVSEAGLVKLRSTGIKYQMNPEYTKFMCMRDIARSALNEGLYAESPNLQMLRGMVAEVVRELMDRGYNDDETERECMNRYRSDNRFIFDDDFVRPLVQETIMDYINECSTARMAEELEEEMGDDVFDNDEWKDDEYEMGFDLDDPDALDHADSEYDDEVMGGELDFDDEYDDEGRSEISARRDRMRNAVAAGGKYAQAESTEQDNIMTLENRIQKALKEGDARTAKRLMAKLREARKPKKNMLESVLDDVIAEMLSEEVNLDQAEVVMATQGMGSDIQDMNEKVGRMMNEDLVAIADQIRQEQGADAAQQFTDNMTAALQGYIDAGKQAKAAVDQVVGTLSGEGAGDISTEPAMPAGDDMGMDDMDMGDDDTMDTNEPAAAGPADEPLGRAEL